MRIIFYDGLCPLCNYWVRWIFQRDHQQLFHFAPLQGETAKKWLSERYPAYTDQDTIVYLDHHRIFLRSHAILEILRVMKRWKGVVRIGFAVPKRIRDFVYRWISKARYLYGRRYATCPLSPASGYDRFLT